MVLSILSDTEKLYLHLDSMSEGRECLQAGTENQGSETRLSENQAHALQMANSAQTEERAQVPIEPPLNCEKQVGGQRVRESNSIHLFSRRLLSACPGTRNEEIGWIFFLQEHQSSSETGLSTRENVLAIQYQFGVASTRLE